MDFYTRARAVGGAAKMSNKKDVKIAFAKHDFAAHFKDSVDYEDNTLVNGLPQKLVVSRSNSVVKEKKIWAYPGDSLNLGDIVDCYNCKWLVTEIEPNDEIFLRGKMELCNRQIQWQNPITGEIVSRWATLSKPYYANNKEIVMTSLSQREYKVQMPFDDETALIDLDKRFMLEIINGEPKTYVTTSVDQSTERYELHGKTQGFLVLNIRQDQYNSKTDNAEKMICDYFEPNKSDEPDADSQVTATIKYAGKPEVRVGGSWKKFTPVFTSITGEEVAEVAKWSFICLDEFKSFVETQVATNDVFKIRILNNSIMDGATVRISLTNADDTANTSIECKVVSLL